MGARWGLATRCTDYRDLVALDAVDAVLVALPEAFHAEVTLAGLAAGKHVLLEKPMCYTRGDADAIVAARAAGAARRAGRLHAPLQPGLPRRVPRAARSSARGDVRLARVHDVIGANALIVGQVAHVIRPDDLADTARKSTTAKKAAQIEAAIGTTLRQHHNTYSMLHGLASHDLSAMREMLGLPRRVSTARRQGAAASPPPSTTGTSSATWKSGWIASLATTPPSRSLARGRSSASPSTRPTCATCRSPPRSPKRRATTATREARTGTAPRPVG